MEPGRWRYTQKTPVVRVSLALAALSWTSWAAGHCCLSGCIRCPRFLVGHAGSLPQGNVLRRPYNMHLCILIRRSPGDCSRRTSHMCSQSRRSVGLLWIERFRTMQCANGFVTAFGDCCSVQSEPMVSGSVLDATVKDNAMCQRIWDQLRRLQQAIVTGVPSQPMVSWFVLDAMTKDNAMCQRIWDQLWRLQQAPITRVQSEPMGSWSVLDATTKDNAMCQRIWDQLRRLQQAIITRVPSQPMVSWFFWTQ